MTSSDRGALDSLKIDRKVRPRRSFPWAAVVILLALAGAGVLVVAPAGRDRR